MININKYTRSTPSAERTYPWPAAEYMRSQFAIRHQLIILNYKLNVLIGFGFYLHLEMALVWGQSNIQAIKVSNVLIPLHKINFNVITLLCTIALVPR